MTESDTQDAVKEYRLDSWREFHKLSETVFVTAPAYVYRGQADFDWPLHSTIDQDD